MSARPIHQEKTSHIQKSPDETDVSASFFQLPAAFSTAARKLRAFKSRKQIKQLLVFVIGLSVVGLSVLQVNSQVSQSLDADAADRQIASYTAVQVVNEDAKQFSISGTSGAGPT